MSAKQHLKETNVGYNSCMLVGKAGTFAAQTYKSWFYWWLSQIWVNNYVKYAFPDA